MFTQLEHVPVAFLLCEGELCKESGCSGSYFCSQSCTYTNRATEVTVASKKPVDILACMYIECTIVHGTAKILPDFTLRWKSPKPQQYLVGAEENSNHTPIHFFCTYCSLNVSDLLAKPMALSQ